MVQPAHLPERDFLLADSGAQRRPAKVRGTFGARDQVVISQVYALNLRPMGRKP